MARKMKVFNIYYPDGRFWTSLLDETQAVGAAQAIEGFVDAVTIKAEYDFRVDPPETNKA